MSYLWDFNISLIGEMLAEFMDLLRSILNDEDSTVTKLIQKKSQPCPQLSLVINMSVCSHRRMRNISRLPHGPAPVETHHSCTQKQ